MTTPDFAAVIDGSTSKGTLRLNGKTSGRLAMEILSETVRETLEPEDDINTAVEKLTAGLKRFYLEQDCHDEAARHAENRLTASMAVYSACRNEVWLLGDCQCRFNGETRTHPKPTESLLAGIRADVLHHLLRKGHSIAELQRHDKGREWILPYLKDQCAFQNAPDAGPFGYAVLDGFPVNMRGMRCLPLPEEVEELVLASDGYPLLCDTLEESERELRQRLEGDPLCIGTPPATKGLMQGNLSFDDRCYLRLVLRKP